MKKCRDNFYSLKNIPLPCHVLVEGSEERLQKISLEERFQDKPLLRISKSLKINTIELVIDWFNAYAQKKEPRIDLPLDKTVFVTLFQKQVIETLQKVTFGQQISYGQLAARAGFLNAFRAVGGLMHRNPYPLVIPCHRVVAKTHLGGFAYGISLKYRLLQYETCLQSG